MTLNYKKVKNLIIAYHSAVLNVRVVNEKEREHRAPRGEDEAPQAPRSTAAGARIEAPKAPRGGVTCGEGVSPPHRGMGLCPSPEKFLILALNMVSLGVFWVVFFTVTCFIRKTGVQPL